MSLFKKAKQAAIARRVMEEKLYEQVLREIEAGGRRDGLWAKALQKAKGNEVEAQGLYIQYRVQALRDESEVSRTSIRQLEETTTAPPLLPATRPEGGALDSYDTNGHTSLMRAVRARDIALVADLLARGANPFVVDRDWGTSTALDIAKRELNLAKNAETRDAFRQLIFILEEARQRILRG